MIKRIKIRLHPTMEQETLFKKSSGARRFAYNWGLSRAISLYNDGICFDKVLIRTEFNEYKKQLSWINDISAQVTQNAFNDLEMAFKNFYKGTRCFPVFKKRKKEKLSFYVRNDRMYFKNGCVKMEKIGLVKYSSNYKIPKASQYINPTCSYDGKYWYLSFGIECETQTFEHTNESIGVDLGIKELAVISNQDEPVKNINKSKEVRRLKKKLLRKQRQLSKKYELNKQGNKYIKTKNIIKLENEIKLINRRLTNIRNNHIHQATANIVKQNPRRVVMEDLNVVGMMKNKHLAKAIQEQKFYEFIRQMKYKCESRDIEFVQADRWFPSSKTCSDCGYINKDLKLSDRIYICPNCGFVIDRDKNASINLSRYELV